MKKNIIIGIFLIFSFSSFSQVMQEALSMEINSLTEKINVIEAGFKNEVKILQIENKNLKSEIGVLNTTLLNTHIILDRLRNRTKENSSAIAQTTNDMGIKIKETDDKNEGRILEVSESLSKNSIYGIIGVVLAILISVVLLWLMRKTKSSIEESLVEEFRKQTALMDSQLLLIEKQKNNLQALPNAELDHSLALKVASEINLIERNINLMDSKIKGLKQLQASVGKLKDNLAANGYEMSELLGKQFHQGMKFIVTSSIPDENLEMASEVRSKFLIPQGNYNDKMSQNTQIELTVGY